MSLALVMNGVEKRYGRRAALNGLDLRVSRGAVLGLVGSNGAGKTTALTAAVGLLSVQGGSIDLLGDGPFDPRRHRGRVALLPQDAHMPGHARLEEILGFYGRLQGLEGTSLTRAIEQGLEQVRLLDRRRETVRSLSHGMRRRLSIAQAFLGNPELVLLDEPLNGLDPREVVHIRGLFREPPPNQTLVISSHILSEVEAVCDHIAFIEQGKTVRQSTLSEILRDDRQVVYRMEPGPVPMEGLRSALPGVLLRQDAEQGTLTIGFSGEAFTAAVVNAAVLPVLLSAGVGVLEIRRGSGLEEEYLASHSGPRA